MRFFKATGDNQFINVQIDSGEQPTGAITQRIMLPGGNPALIASLVNPDTGACPLASNVQIIITGPDGTIYNTAQNTSTTFVAIVKSNTYMVCILNPPSGLWTIKCICTNDTFYRANLTAIPKADQIQSTMGSMSHYIEKSEYIRGDQFTYELYKWSYWPISALIKAMQQFPTLQMNLQQLLNTIFGSPDSLNSQILNLSAQQNIEGINLTISQLFNLVSDNVLEEVILNGSGNDMLNDWTIDEAGGAGWTVQQHYAAPIQYTNNFAVSNGWCKKSQLIDLINDVGLSKALLDKSPPITVRDYITAFYPPSATAKSQYMLTVELRDTNHNVIKRIASGNIALTQADGQTATTLNWQAMSFYFENYGSNVRYVYFQHGGLNPEIYASNDYGVKITGASVKVQLDLPEYPDVNVLENGSARNGLDGWTSAPGSTVWSIDTGAGIACPGSPGTKDFSSTEGTATKYQEIDLVAKGYTPAFLDQMPIINIGDWMCVEQGCDCTYRLEIDLLDAHKNVVLSFDSGNIKMDATSLGVTPFVKYNKTLSNYGTGVRFIKFQHSATPEKIGMAARLTGATVELPPIPSTRMQKRETEIVDSLPPAIKNTTIEPYKWVCYLQKEKSTGTGWLTPQATSGSRLIGTAAHVVKSDGDSWSTMSIVPGAGNGAVPYQSTYKVIEAPINHCQVPYEWLVDAQTKVGDDTSYDFAAIYVNQNNNWDLGGFVPTQNDASSFGASVAGFPAKTTALFFPSSFKHGDMYTENVKIKKYNDSHDSSSTQFGPGASGGPYYLKSGTAYQSVAIVSYGTPWNEYGFRINDLALDRLNNWKTRLTPGDTITKFQMVIRTADDFGAGTDADIHATIGQDKYELEKLWAGGAGFFRSRNERGDYDGYDLTPRLKELFPNGAKVSDLIDKTYSIHIEFSSIGVNLDVFGLSNESWKLESVALYVNDQMLCAHNFNNWLQPNGQDEMGATISL